MISAERWRLCFHLCWFVCLFVFCAFGHYGYTPERIFMDFSGYIGHDTRNNLENLGMSRLTHWVLDFFFCVFKKSVFVSNITGKQMNGFSWNFQQRLDMRPGTTCVIVGMLQLTTWIQGRFFYSLDPCFSNVMEKRVSGYSWNFHEISRATHEIII